MSLVEDTQVFTGMRWVGSKGIFLPRDYCSAFGTVCDQCIEFIKLLGSISGRITSRTRHACKQQHSQRSSCTSIRRLATSRIIVILIAAEGRLETSHRRSASLHEVQAIETKKRIRIERRKCPACKDLQPNHGRHGICEQKWQRLLCRMCLLLSCRESKFPLVTQLLGSMFVIGQNRGFENTRAAWISIMEAKTWMVEFMIFGQ